MLPAYALRPLLRYFDAIDEIVSMGLTTVTPYKEVALTSDLCSLMDEHEQSKFALRHNAAWLRHQLVTLLPLTDIEVGISTIEYPSHVENLVTQSDLGLIVEYTDHIVLGREWQAAALLQAKRLRKKPTDIYTGASSYSSYDREQHNRIETLHEILGYELVRYLLYTPRPEKLDPTVAGGLRHRRDLNIGRWIYDYADGLAIHRELTRRRRFVDGGVIVSPVAPRPTRLDVTYDRLFDDNLTWSWFLALLLIETTPPVHGFAPEGVLPDRLDFDALRALPISPIDLAAGDHVAANIVAGRLAEEDLTPFPILPRRTIRIRVTVSDSPDRVQNRDR